MFAIAYVSLYSVLQLLLTVKQFLDHLLGNLFA